MRVKIAVDYVHEYQWDTDLERLGDGVIEVTPEELVQWSSCKAAWDAVQDIIAKRMQPVYDREEQARRRRFIEDGMIENYLEKKE